MPQLLQNSPSRRNPNPCPLQNPSAGGWVLPHLAHTWTLQQHPLPQAPLTKGWLLWHQELNLCVWLVHNSTLAVRAGQTQRHKTKVCCQRIYTLPSEGCARSLLASMQVWPPALYCWQEGITQAAQGWETPLNSQGFHSKKELRSMSKRERQF